MVNLTEEEKVLAVSELDGTECICLINALSLSEDKAGGWKESGKQTPIRWILPCTVIDFEEEKIGDHPYFIITIEFSSRHSEWSTQRIKFSVDRISAISETKKLIKTLLKWQNGEH